MVAVHTFVHHLRRDNQPIMTSNDPDPRAFKTWEDAFQYPIPAVRKFEQQLRQHADENRQKLRNLVGYVFPCRLYLRWSA